MSYNTRDVTDACLKSIYDADWRDKFEVIVVDNNSSDGSVEMIREKYPEVKVIANPDNRLFAIANNQGAKIAQGKYLLLLNSDTLVYGDNLQRMIDFFERQPENVICIGPKILNSDKTIQSYGHPKYGLMEHFICQMRFHKVFPILGKFWHTLPISPDITHEVGWVSGCCMMIPRKLYEKVGGLNERLEFYGEEPEFGYRTERLGYKTIYYHEVGIIHLGGQSTKKEQKNDAEVSFRRYCCLVRECNGYKEAIKISYICILANSIKMLLNPFKSSQYIKIINRQRKLISQLKMQPV